VKLGKKGTMFLLILMPLLLILFCSTNDHDTRMRWWRQARFGMFIHWGLYSIPAGEWKGETRHAEWIRNSAQIPLKEYEKFVNKFNPIRFNADEWVRTAKEAGMKYIVITSKHHDGFCLFDSKYTEFDIMSTPFKRDILKELADACRRENIKICWYYSIMDWHHPDYLPRRRWETDRSTKGADFNRYIAYMKNQLKELTSNYGKIGVLWFDGEWESTWNSKYGRDLYNYVRSLQPDIIINNRVGAGRSGMEGLTKKGEYAGDFGTPEQQIPATGLPGVDWETCMTMNDHWGYNKHDNNWKSAEELIHKLVDIASKGGNFLLNVGPKSDGTFPQQSIDRLKAIGEWMRLNGESIYGTEASPFKHLKWGRCTRKHITGGTRLYLHVFDWPVNGKLIVPGIFNKSKKAYLITDPKRTPLSTTVKNDTIIIDVPEKAPDRINSVVVLDIKGKPDINTPPDISSDFDQFVNELEISISSDRDNVTIRYTLDGNDPDARSAEITGPIRITNTTTVSARCFRDGKPVSKTVKKIFRKVKPHPAVDVSNPVNGISYSYYEGDWNRLPDFNKLKPVKSGHLSNFNLSPKNQTEHFGFMYEGYILIPEDGVYSFYTDSDDGSRLYIDNELVVDNDGLHGLHEEEGVIPLAKGFHSIRVTFFEKTGGDDLFVSFRGRGVPKQRVPNKMLYIKI